MRWISLWACVLVAGMTSVAAAGGGGAPHDVKAAVTALRQDDWFSAIALATKAIDSGELKGFTLVSIFNTRAIAYHHVNRDADALADFAHSLDLASAPGYAKGDVGGIYSNRAGVYNSMRRYDLAVSDASEALRLNPNDYVAYHYRGVARAKLGNFEAAINDFRAALHIRPDFGSARAELTRYGIH
ncbi:MAG: tetratricopeptide repeat protein [Alphaproteobacteria bacterium]|nr:tetratricopeptide repeat protein [Alphaproteobacteria bacterium]